jgi:mannonate dehydratase
MNSMPPPALTRRAFLTASGAAAGALAVPTLAPTATAAARAPGSPAAALRPGPIMKIGEVFSPPEDQLWRLVKQCGATHAVGSFGGNWDRERAHDERPWHYGPLARLKQAYEAGGFELTVVESRPPTDKVKLGQPGRDEQIEEVCGFIRNLGRLHIPVWCYEWMPVNNWTRTNNAVAARGGALVTAFDRALATEDLSTRHGKFTHEDLWQNLKYFLERVVPVAEKAGVKLAMHPDDPPIPVLRGLPRIMGSIENYQRLLDLVPSEANGITLCQGNFTLMTNDLPGVIRRFGRQRRIHFVHFRDVRGTPDKFEETFHDDGMTNMAECMRAYRDIGFAGVCRPDHVPTLDGDSNAQPGYSKLGRLFALGYIRGLIQSPYSEKV